MTPHKHHVWYYETDQMSVVHHGNYIRWMEEGRMAFLQEKGLSCVATEKMGIIIPVTSIACQYKHSAKLDDDVFIHVTMTAFTGVRMSFSYEMTLPDGTVVATGESSHCFLVEGIPVNLKRKFPTLCQTFLEE